MELLRVEPSASEKSSTSEKSTLGMLKVYHILLQFFGIFTQLCRNYREPITKNDCEEETSSVDGLIKKFEKLSLKERGKRGLYICDNYFYSHTKFNDVIVYTRSVGGQKVDPKNVNLIINVPISENKLDKNIIKKEGLAEAFNEFQRYSIKFRIGIYEEIISNKQVKIGEEMVGVYDWLSKQEYSFGIAEFNSVLGALAVFEALGIENTFNVSAVPFIQGYLQYLGIDTLYNIPDFSSAMPGDWLNNGGLLVKESKRYTENKLNNVIASRKLAYLHSYLSLTIFNSFYDEGNVKDLRLPSSIEFLLKKIKLHFVNQNSLANFKEFLASEKIIPIGGLLVEQNKILIQEKVKAKEYEPKCVVLVTFGTVNLTGMLDLKSMEKMFEEFEKHSHCLFKARLNKFVPENYNKNIIKVTDEILPQKEILGKIDTINQYLSKDS
uniref:glucuronosyltransferase n=1 Tax=Meloidogyne floridensis TaxID=298350 RepID=A0A915PCF3_9BILA